MSFPSSRCQSLGVEMKSWLRSPYLVVEYEFQFQLAEGFSFLNSTRIVPFSNELISNVMRTVLCCPVEPFALFLLSFVLLFF